LRALVVHQEVTLSGPEPQPQILGLRLRIAVQFGRAHYAESNRGGHTPRSSFTRNEAKAES
jgi:hypothetical protein